MSMNLIDKKGVKVCEGDYVRSDIDEVGKVKAINNNDFCTVDIHMNGKWVESKMNHDAFKRYTKVDLGEIAERLI